MNRLGWILVMLACTGMMLFGQKTNENEAEFEEAMQEFEEAMDEVSIELNEALEDIPITINIRDFNGDNPKMGVYLADLDFEDIYEMHYEKNYGVLLTGTTTDGPAQKAGMMKGDIIMEFDGEKVKFEDHLTNLIASHIIGDIVTIKFFRMGKEFETQLTLSNLSRKTDGNLIITKTGKKKKKLSVGHGGGSWIPVWYTPDLADINGMLSKLDFKDETFSEDGFLLQGGGGKGNVGKGWFIGGMGVEFKDSQTTHVDWDLIHNGNAIGTVDAKQKASYEVSYWGVTLDKRFALSKKFITSVGFALGGGMQKITISKTADNGSVDDFNFQNPDVSAFFDYKSKLKMDQKYIVFQPKAMFMYRIIDWLGLRAEVGYLASYSGKDWKVKHNDESVKMENDPGSSMNGLTLSIGPWFGF